MGLLLILPFLCLQSCGESEGLSFHSNVEDHVFPTLYDDSCFALDNAAYHQEIALPSYATAMASIRSDCDYESRSGFVLELWEKEGFSSFFVSDSFKEKPTLDSIGYAIAHKEIDLDGERCHLIAIAIRSGAYEGEWANNITIGSEGDATGVSGCANVVYEGLLSYLEKEAYSGRTKFWLSGYSRGGSVANLLSGTLIDALEDGGFPSKIKAGKKDVYAYCFEAIACANNPDIDPRGERYQGVKNLLNFNDLIPHVIPHAWGFSRYGEDLYYPDRLTDIRFSFGVRRTMLNHYRYEEGGHKYTPYTVDDWKFYDVGEATAKENNLPRESVFPSIGRFARAVVQGISNTIYRQIYAGLIEGGLRNLIAALVGLNPDIGEQPIAASGALNLINDFPFLRGLFFELVKGDAGSFAADMRFFLYKLFGANEKNYGAIKDLCSQNFFLFALVSAAFLGRRDIGMQFFSRDNLAKLFQCHYTELNYSFTRSCDKRIYGEEACELNDGSYYLLHVEKAEAITLVENTYGKVFSLQGGKMESLALSAERLNDGSVNIYLPKNGDYSYSCHGTSVRLSEVDSLGDEHPLKEDMPQSGRIEKQA